VGATPAIPAEPALECSTELADTFCCPSWLLLTAAGGG